MKILERESWMLNENLLERLRPSGSQKQNEQKISSMHVEAKN